MWIPGIKLMSSVSAKCFSQLTYPLEYFHVLQQHFQLIVHLPGHDHVCACVCPPSLSLSPLFLFSLSSSSSSSPLPLSPDNWVGEERDVQRAHHL